MGADYTCSHAAALARMLPADSRLAKAEHPELEWSIDTYILSHIEHKLRVIAWQATEDGHKGRNEPRHIVTPYDRMREGAVEASATPEAMERVADALNIPKDRR